MKIQRIEIHNVASIESAAIDFAAGPLADDNLFLICGETGSGKTTILNSITLALYNSTPALLAYGSNDKDANGVTTKNASQMLRRGAADGFVNLFFTGNDGVDYRAIWTARRIKTRDKTLKVEVKNRIERQLDGARTELTTEELTGLTFKQFTQTTILAQGQFTKFLLADEQEKAEILEKLTGTEIYATIGKRIFEMLKAKEDELKSLNDRIAGAKLLSDEEKKALEDERPELNGAIVRCAKSLKEIDLKLKWLCDMETIGKRVSETSRRLEAANAKLVSEEHKDRVEALSLWEDTKAVRATMKEISQAKAELEVAESGKSKLADKHSRLLGGISWLKGERGRLQERADALSVKVEDRKEREPIYAKAEAIALLAKTAETELREADACKARIEGLKRDICKFKDTLVGEEEASKAAQNEYDQATTYAKRMEADAKMYDIKKISETVESLRCSLEALQNASRSHEKYLESKSGREKADAELTDVDSEVGKKEGEIKTLKRQLPAFEVIAKEKAAFLEGMMELNDHIHSLRRRFAQTGECPLCGTKGVDLATDAMIDSRLAQAREQAESAQKAYSDTHSQLAAAEAALSTLSGDLKKKAAAKQKAEEAERKAIEEAEKAAKAIGISIHNDNFEKEISRLVEAKTKEKENETEILHKALEAKEEYDEALKAQEKARNKLDSVNQNLEGVRKKITDKEAKISAEEMLEKKANDAAMQALTQIEAAIGEERKLTIDDAKDISDRIAKDAGEYAADKRLLADDKLKISDLDTRISHAEKSISHLANAFKDAGACPPKEIPDLPAAIADLIVKVSAVDERIESFSAAINSKQKAVDEYLSSPQGRSIDEISKAQAYAEEEIAKIRTGIKALDDELIAACAACAEVGKQKEEHEKTRPEITEEETAETLSEQRARIDAEREEAGNRLSAVNALLKSDWERSAELAQTKRRRDELKEECADWSQLENLYGGAKGQKFRLIAQCYVLRTLLQKANHYLKTLSLRYELYCVDNSLVINVIDHDQNDTARAVNLLSGGESFIVSLALALGLSSISKEKLHVDTLFIDEGFGSLDAATLETVITTLNRLHAIGGRRVGIISHVGSLAERIPTQIRMRRTGPGKSAVEIIKF